MSINFTQQEMHDITFECAVATLKRIDRPYVKVLAIIPVVGAAIGPTKPDVMVALLTIFSEQLNEDPRDLIIESLKLKDALVIAIEKAKAEKGITNV